MRTAGFSTSVANNRKGIVTMDLVILQAEAAAGMYRKPIEVLVRELHYYLILGFVGDGIEEQKVHFVYSPRPSQVRNPWVLHLKHLYSSEAGAIF